MHRKVARRVAEFDTAKFVLECACGMGATFLGLVVCVCGWVEGG